MQRQEISFSLYVSQCVCSLSPVKYAKVLKPMLKSILIFFFVKTYIRGNHTFSSTYWKLSYLCSVPGTEIAMHMPLGGAKIAASKDGRTWVLNMNMRRDINQSCKWNASMWDIDFSYFQRQCSQDFMSANESILRRLFEPLTHYLLKGNNDATLELAHTSQLPASFSNSTYNDITVVVSVVMLVISHHGGDSYTMEIGKWYESGLLPSFLFFFSFIFF